MSKEITWDDMVSFLMSKKPSSLQKYIRESMPFAIDKKKDKFIKKELKHVNSGMLLRAYDDLDK